VATSPITTFDSIVVAYYRQGKLYYAAKVRNGFVPRVRIEVFQRLKGLKVDACPFVNLPEKKRTQWALTQEEEKPDDDKLESTRITSLSILTKHESSAISCRS